MEKPVQKPKRPFFSSGPCCKRPGWSLHALDKGLIARSHRASVAKEKLRFLIEKTKSILKIPHDYRIGIVPGSDTGAIEMAMWSFLGQRPVTVLAWDVFGGEWLTDIVSYLKLENTNAVSTPPGILPDLSQVDFHQDVVFTWNGTTSGVCVPDGDWIASNREGLTICDAISSVLAVDLPWPLLDVTTFSWQKGIGSEAAHGMIVLSPRAVERLTTYTPPWPLPKVFRLAENKELREGIFQGLTLNTPSMLCVEDCLDALEWVEKNGGLTASIQRSKDNFRVLEAWVESCPWIDFLAVDPRTRSTTSVCLKLVAPQILARDETEQWKIIRHIADCLEREEAAFDIKGHDRGAPCLRIWAGPTVDAEDLRKLIPWIEWAYEEAHRLYGE